MPGPMLDHVQIAAPSGCEPAARHFFGDLLGLAELPKPAPLSARGGCWFALGDRQLHIGVDPDFSPARKAHLALRVDPAELDVLAARLSAAGAPITWDTAIPTERRFYSAAPGATASSSWPRPSEHQL
jgi:catechol 2,3-dioxygenase-like lactoylglutathione lyase family enzyme